MYIPNRSPSLGTELSPASSDFASTLHSQAGYSLSSKATGSGLFFMKLRPFNTVPAGTLLCGNFAAAFVGLALLVRSCRDTFGVRGALKGCATPGVVVAAGAS